MKRITVLIAALALSACGQPATTTTTEPGETVASDDTTLPAGEACPAGPQAMGDPVTFTCSDNVSFTVRYEEQTGCAVVAAGGQTYRLGSAISGSGARYSNGATQYWEHQGEAMLEGAAGGPYTECKSPANE